jgi:hypothetical protein
VTTSPQAHRPSDLTARILVAAGGAVILLLLAVVGAATSWWFTGVAILILIPVHAILAITDTSLLEKPASAPSRAIAELRRMSDGRGATGPGPTGWSAPASGGRPSTPGIPMGFGRSFDPPTPGGPSVVHGFGSYGARPRGTAPTPTPPPPAPEPPPPAPTPPVSTPDPDDDPDLTIQRPPRDH